MSNKNYLNTLWIALAFCFGTVGMALAQNSGANQRWQGGAHRDPLAMLERAIQKAGAPALSADQQSQLQSLIQNYRSTRSSMGPDPAVQSARQNFEAAVLSGNSANSTAAADALAGAMTANAPKHLEALAQFEVQAVGILQPQLSALQQNLGNDRLLSLLGSLAGGPGMRAGMGGFGRR